MLGKRTVAYFSSFMLIMLLTVLSVYTLSNGTKLAETADRQSTYRLTLAHTRGTIYDCNKNPLIGGEKQYVAAVVPSVEGTAALNKALPKSEMALVYPMLTKGKPFSLNLPDSSVSASGIDVFSVDKRYLPNQTAAHVIGYLDGAGNGVMGIEKAFNTQLTANQGAISVLYKVDAVDRVLAGESEKIENTYNLKNSGVVLTLDRQIQDIAEKAAQKYLKTGAVVITEVPNCQIRAMASVPTFSPTDVSAALKSEDSPFVNRALSAYNVGSVFKLVSAAAALENGISPNTQYTCNGVISVSGIGFRCFNGESHGKEDMKEAIAQSCNDYFVSIMQKVPQKKFLSMAESLGFGKETVLADGYSSDPGNLPTLETLKMPRALANFSFGQGDLLATPLQINGMINAIASKGVYKEPYLVEGLVDANQNYTQKHAQQKGNSVMSENTAELLRSFMAASVDHGTSKKGKPTVGGAGAKTGTAQTGIVKDGKEVIQAWFAGYYPQENPKYVITVLGENGEGGGDTCAPVFKQITDELAKLEYGQN
ncbi:MAG TPA: penicillin-binding protein 2 [Oscillospiraceae bacterium]|nr:penicillin-binding protein 2 [Oscillospiraceae bacterium]